MEPTAGHGEKQTRKQHLAIAALIATSTVKEAAVKAGVSDATLRRWLQVPEFLQLYHCAQRQVLTDTMTGLQASTGAAGAKFVELLSCGNKSIELRAAQAILDNAFKGREIDELEQRLEHLERIEEQREQARIENR